MGTGRGAYEIAAAMYEVRGPDPDGDWFVVQIDGDNETAIDETFATEAAAKILAEKLNQEGAAAITINDN